MKFIRGHSQHLFSDIGEPLRLVVFVDTEEEFEWHTYSPRATSVRNIAAQVRAQDILDAFGLKPTYLVDYPVASQPEGFEPLRAMAAKNRCSVGAQLHPWVNPPILEEITLRNTYAGNLPRDLEYAKIERLTQTITMNFGAGPRVFKAGRYGAGPFTSKALIDCGYIVDTSIMPMADFSAEGGPDYTSEGATPYWVDERRKLLELPATVGLVGMLERTRARGIRLLLNGPSNAFKIPAVLSYFRMLDRIRLTPEGISIEEAKRLTLSQLRHGQRIFVLSYHSSSMLAGGNPYVTSEQDVVGILRWLEEYCRFFFGPLGGKPSSAEEIYEFARGLRHGIPMPAA